jgi:hypothetical protein
MLATSWIVILQFLRTSSFTHSAFSSVLLVDGLLIVQHNIFCQFKAEFDADAFFCDNAIF